MKLKKTLSGVLAAAMVVSLTPAMAFATTSNTVSTVPTVASSEKMPATNVYLEVKDVAGWNETISKTISDSVYGTGKAVGKVTLGSTVPSVDKVYTYSGTGWESPVGTDASSEIGAGKIELAATYSPEGGDTLVFMKGGTATSVQKINITLDNAKFNKELKSSTGSAIFDEDGAVALSAKAKTGKILATKYIASSDTSLELELYAASPINEKDIITLAFAKDAIKSGSEDGPVTLSINGLDSQITSSTLTIATVGNSTTTATVSGDVKTYPRGDVSPVNSTIEIRETAINSLVKGSYQLVKLTLPKGVTWKSVPTISGDLTNIEFDSTLRSGELALGTGVAAYASLDSKSYASATNDGRTLYLAFKVTGEDTVRNVMTIKPNISISKDANVGEIAVSVTGLAAKKGADDKNTVSDASDLVIANYGDESVTVSTVSEIPTIIAGYVKNSKDKNFTVKVTLKENMQNALSAGRYVDFDLPEEVQICGIIKAKLNSGSNTTADPTYVEIGDYTNSSDNNTGIAGMTTALATNVPVATLDDTSAFTFKVPGQGAPTTNGTWKNDAGNTITFEIPVTVEADYTGDITLTVKGAKAGVEETELVVATAESPIKVETTTTDVKNGVQKQAVADITITEAYPGYLDDTTKENSIVLSIDTLGLSQGMVFEDYDSIEVTAGDIELGKHVIDAPDKGEDPAIIIPIKNSSTKASTIVIKGAVVALNRTLPEGGYDLLVGGNALVKNSAYDDDDFTGTAVKVKDYVSIVTPADSVTVSEKVDAKFVIGEASYTNNGAATEMDAAAYIDSHNRTMVPIRYVANACGISENDIRWEAGSQTAIINGLNTVVTVKMGSNKLQTSTGEITMDTVAVNNNGRIYVPVRYIANALGANVSWDAATKTVTLTK